MADTAGDAALYAVVEIMGRRTRAGAISDAQLGGQTLLRIEHPTRRDHTGEQPLAEYYAGQAIFAVRPCSRDDAERVAAWAWPPHHAPTTPELPVTARDYIDDDDLDDDEVSW